MRRTRGDGRGGGEHRKFWEMHDLLFENQDALEDEQLIVYAETLGIDPAWRPRRSRTGVLSRACAKTLPAACGAA